jgi:hypothetical protein
MINLMDRKADFSKARKHGVQYYIITITLTYR